MKEYKNICVLIAFSKILAFDNNKLQTNLLEKSTVALVHTLYECNLCDYAGDSKSQLAKHMGDVHGKNPCDQCGKKVLVEDRT